MKKIIFTAMLIILTACAGINTSVILQKTTVVTASLQLKNNYVATKNIIVANIDKFSDSDVEILKRESEQVERFYNTLVGLSDTQDAEIVLDVDTLVGLSGTVRVSANSLAEVTRRNLGLFDPSDRITVSQALRNHSIVELDFARTLSVGDRAAKKDALIQLLRTVTSLALAVGQATGRI